MTIKKSARFGLLVIFFASLSWLLVAFVWGHAAPDSAAIKIQGPDTLGNFGAWVIPPNQVNATASTTNGGALTADLPAVSGKTTYITGVVWTENNATAIAGHIIITIGSLGSGGSIVFESGGNTSPVAPIVITFSHPIPASASNTAITVRSTADAVRAPNATLSAWGFQF